MPNRDKSLTKGLMVRRGKPGEEYGQQKEQIKAGEEIWVDLLRGLKQGVLEGSEQGEKMRKYKAGQHEECRCGMLNDPNEISERQEWYLQSLLILRKEQNV